MRPKIAALCLGTLASIFGLPAHSELLIKPGAKVDMPQGCSSKIGQGGNLVSGELSMPGKCEGGGKPASLTGDAAAPVISFRVEGGVDGKKDRSEIALTRHRFKFGQENYVSFEVNIPDGSQRTNTWLYLVQFWQGGERPPLAGLRMDRGESHMASIIARGEEDRRGQSVAKVDLPPGKWVKVTLMLDIEPEDESCIAAWVSNDQRREWCGQIGFIQDGTLKDWYRMKFGVYKGGEQGKNFQASFRSIKVGRKLADVQ